MAQDRFTEICSTKSMRALLNEGSWTGWLWTQNR
jgi:hypothetical protein